MSSCDKCGAPGASYRLRHDCTPGQNIWRIVERLREGEGHSITFLCDNPDFNGQPNSAVECCGDWTNWVTRRFTGDTPYRAVEAAFLAFEKHTRALPSQDHPK